jgi:hypothetical protein
MIRANSSLTLPTAPVPLRLISPDAVTVPVSVGEATVGEVPKTKAPVPVSSVTAEIRFALDGVVRKVSTPVPKAKENAPVDPVGPVVPCKPVGPCGPTI